MADRVPRLLHDDRDTRRGRRLGGVSRTAHGTHEGEFEGVAPTGKQVDFRTMVFNRFADGIVVENWGLHDHASVLEQLRGE